MQSYKIYTKKRNFLEENKEILKVKSLDWHLFEGNSLQETYSLQAIFVKL